LEELDNYSIYLEWRLSSDHAPLTISIPIEEQYIHNGKCSVAKGSVEEKVFIKDVIKDFTTIDTSNLIDIESLKIAINSFALAIDRAWEKNSKIVTISRHLKSWWNMNCSRDLEKYRSTRSLVDWKQFKKTVKSTKHIFFDQKIQEISNKARGHWELVNWVKERNLSAVKAIKYNNCSCLEIHDLWNALHFTFNLAQDRYVNVDILDEIPNKSTEEFRKAIAKCNNSSASGPDKLSWSHLKCIINNEACLGNIISIANVCFELGLWLSHFKSSTTIIISKPNKESYDSPKSFQPIILLNTLGKLIEKVISKCLQFSLISNGFIHLCQLGGLKQKSTSDTSVALTHFICSGWTKNNTTSTLAFDIA